MPRRSDTQPSWLIRGVSDQAATTDNGTSRVIRTGLRRADRRYSSTRLGTSLTRLLITIMRARSSMSSLTLPMGNWYAMVQRPEATLRSALVAARGGRAKSGNRPPVGSPRTLVTLSVSAQLMTIVSLAVSASVRSATSGSVGSPLVLMIPVRRYCVGTRSSEGGRVHRTWFLAPHHAAVPPPHSLYPVEERLSVSVETPRSRKPEGENRAIPPIQRAPMIVRESVKLTLVPPARRRRLTTRRRWRDRTRCPLDLPSLPSGSTRSSGRRHGAAGRRESRAG